MYPFWSKILTYLWGWATKSCSRWKLPRAELEPPKVCIGKRFSKHSASLARRCGFFTHFGDPMKVRMKSKMGNRYSAFCSNCWGQNLLVSNKFSQIFSMTNSGMYFKEGGWAFVNGNVNCFRCFKEFNLVESSFRHNWTIHEPVEALKKNALSNADGTKSAAFKDKYLSRSNSNEISKIEKEKNKSCYVPCH